MFSRAHERGRSRLHLQLIASSFPIPASGALARSSLLRCGGLREESRPLCDRSPPASLSEFSPVPRQTIALPVRTMLHTLAIVALTFDFVPHALRNHQPVDAVGGQVFHVAIEQAGAFAVEHAIAIADDGAHRRTRSGERDRSNACSARAADRDARSAAWAVRNLIGIRETARRRFRSGRDARSRRRPSGSWLRSSYLLPELSGRARLVPRRCGWDKAPSCRQWPGRRACGKSRASACGSSGRRAHRAEWCCGRAKPSRVFKHEVNQRRHVVPASKVQAEAVVAQIEEKFLHLMRQRMRLHQRHALDVIRGQAFRLGEGLKQVAPPQSFFGGLALRNVDREIMRQRALDRAGTRAARDRKARRR